MANQKRISELPIINTLSGSAASVIPVVVGGTTNQISAENFSKFVNAYNATTSSNTFIGNQTITGDLDISGNTIIGGDVEVAGMITAQQYNVTYVSSSIQYQSGSTEFGDTADDTHTFTGTILLNGSAIGFGELNAQTASQDSINFGISVVTSSIDSHILGVSQQTASQDSINFGISIVTSSIDAHILGVSEQTSSQNSINSGISAVTGAFAVELGSVDSHILGVSQQTASQDLVNLGISSVTGSLIGITNGLMAFTAALDDSYATDAQLYQLYQATRSLEIQTGSQNSINSGISAVTGAFATELSGIQNNITSFNNVFGGVSAVTGAFSTELGQLQTQNTSQNGVNSGISAVTGAFATELGSIDSHILKQATQTGSQDLVNLGISSVTGSLIGITNGLMAFTAALDSTYATDAQVAAAVAGLNTQTGSQNSINSGISAVTGAFTTELSGIQNNITSFNNVFGGVSAVTGAFATELGGIQTTLSGHRNELDGLESYTASLKGTTLISGSSQIPQIAELFTQNTSQLGVNLGISTFTGSLRDEVNGIEAYTASLKGAIEVSGQNVNVLGTLTAQEIYTTYVTSSVMYQSGSTKFGDTNDDKHQFTGSVSISGSGDFYIGGPLGESTDKAAITIKQTSTSANNGIYIERGGERKGYYVYLSSLNDSLAFQRNNAGSKDDVLLLSRDGDVDVVGGNLSTNTGDIIAGGNFSTINGNITIGGSSKFGDSSSDIHEFTGSKFEVYNSDSSGTMYAVVKNNRARNAAVKTTTTNGSFIAGTSIGTDTFQYQIYDEVEGVSRVTINSQGGTTLQGAVTASQTLRVGGKTQIGTSTVDTSLGSNTKLSVVGDGNVNAGASQGSLFVAVGNEGGDTGLPINMGTAGATMMLLASINTSTGTATNSATYIVRFYFDGDNAPTTSYLGGSSDFVTFGVTPNNTLAVSGSSSGNKSYAWFINKFGA